VTTGRNRDDGRRLFCRFLTATPTHRYALTSDLFPAGAHQIASRMSGRLRNDGTKPFAKRWNEDGLAGLFYRAATEETDR
jgi:hypothetical protein